MVIQGGSIVNYQCIAEAMSSELIRDENDWQKRFGNYINIIEQNKEYIARVEKKISCQYPLRLYLPLSNNNSKVIKKPEMICFDLRYKGNKLGTIEANCDEALFHPYTDRKGEQIVSDVEKLQSFDNYKWGDELEGEIRRILKEEIETDEEHQFESCLLNDFANSHYENKVIPYITPVTWTGNRSSFFQMPTTWKGSKISERARTEEKLIQEIRKGSFWAVDSMGGGIDILARRIYRPAKPILSIMELKNPSGSFSEYNVILQAIAYAVFIRELIRSKKANGEKWWKFFISGGTSSSTELQLEAVVLLAAKKRNKKPDFAESVIKLGEDKISLHYLYLEQKEDKSNGTPWTIKDTSLKIQKRKDKAL